MAQSAETAPTTLFLFTHAYPYDVAETFLEAELPVLARQFSRVILVPFLAPGLPRSLPEKVEIDLTLSRASASLTCRLQGIGSPLLYGEAAAGVRALHNLRGLPRAIAHLSKALQVKAWVQQRFQQGDIAPEQCLFYTYWFAFQTFGIGLAKSRFPLLRLVTRLHGWDVYEDRHTPPYLPFRRQAMELTDRCFFISEHGRRYFTEKYPAATEKTEVARLGVPDPGIINVPSADGVLRVVSCSALTPVKRVPLLVAGLQAFARAYPNCSVEWHHLGGGPQREQVISLLSGLPSSIRGVLHGLLPHRAVLDFYRVNSVDVFVNVSASEGVPISIMEAQSCGIPVIGTAVGGTPEIVNTDNGLLLDADPEPEAIARALAEFAPTASGPTVKRAASRLTWQRLENAETNFQAFASRLAQVRDG